jgi:hypothetical protein
MLSRQAAVLVVETPDLLSRENIESSRRQHGCQRFGLVVSSRTSGS